MLVSTPPNTCPENCTLRPGHKPTVLVQVIRFVAEEVAVQAGLTVNGSVLASKFS
jgi:hypothetical protein